VEGVRLAGRRYTEGANPVKTGGRRFARERADGGQKARPLWRTCA